MSDLVTVSILGLPLDVMQRTSEHNDELLREFERQVAGQAPTAWSMVVGDLAAG